MSENKYKHKTKNLVKYITIKKIEKQYLFFKNLLEISNKLNKIEHLNKKFLTPQLLKPLKLTEYEIMYVINIYFTSTNTFVTIADVKGVTKLFLSGGHLKLRSRQKKFQPRVILNLLKILLKKASFLKGKRIAFHFYNVNQFAQRLILSLLKKNFFIIFIKNYLLHPFNGCRPKKLKRLKRKKR
jgi:ribosomal protein S11